MENYLLKTKDLLEQYVEKIKQKKMIDTKEGFSGPTSPAILGNTVVIKSHYDNFNLVHGINGKNYGDFLVTKNTKLVTCEDKYNPAQRVHIIYPLDVPYSNQYDGLQRIKITDENCSVYSDGESYFFVDAKNTKINKLTFLENGKSEEKQYELSDKFGSYRIKFICEYIIFQKDNEVLVYDYLQNKVKCHVNVLDKLSEEFAEEDNLELYLFDYNKQYITFCFRKVTTIDYRFQYINKEHSDIEFIGCIDPNNNMIQLIKTNNPPIDFALEEYRCGKVKKEKNTIEIGEGGVDISNEDTRNNVNEVIQKITHIYNIHVRIINGILVYIDPTNNKIKFYSKDTGKCIYEYANEGDNAICDFTEACCVSLCNGNVQITV